MKKFIPIRLQNLFQNLSITKMVVLAILCFIFTVVYYWIAEILGLDMLEIPYPSNPGVFFWIVAIVLAPIVETLLIQALPLTVLSKLKVPQTIAIFVSALFFAILHVIGFPFSTAFSITALPLFVGGIALASAYTVAKTEGGTKNAIKYTALFHATFNVQVMAYNIYLVPYFS